MAEATPGPSAEEKSRYETLRSELIKALPRKRTMDRALAQIELQIYNLETSYLTETAAHSGGNIIQGFDGYLKNQAVGRRRYEVNENDRLFSRSSVTYQKSLDLMGEGEDSTATNDDYVKQPTPGVTTVVVPPATRNQELSMAQQKRIRDKDYQRRKRGLSLRSGDSDEDIISAASTSSRRPSKRARMADED